MPKGDRTPHKESRGISTLAPARRTAATWAKRYGRTFYVRLHATKERTFYFVSDEPGPNPLFEVSA